MARPGWIQRAWSYLRPVNLERSVSLLNPVLEINLHRGKITLDAATVNYSMGSLHYVMEQALLHALVVYGLEPRKALLLGYGGGSAAGILEQMYPGIEITALEHDAEVIRLARKWFDGNQVNLIQADAATWMAEPETVYDLVLCDLFTEDRVPAFALGPDFYQRMAQWLSPNGIFIQNTMFGHEPDDAQQRVFDRYFSDTTKMRMLEVNMLYFGRRPAFV